jgi:hypothetical protein
MARDQVTGASPLELDELWEEYQSLKPCEEGLPFETYYCLAECRQPPEYTGPPRYCMMRPGRVSEEEWEEHYAEEYGEYDPYHRVGRYATCRKHLNVLYEVDPFPDIDRGKPWEAILSNIQHGIYTEDEHLQMDFTDEEQERFDWIMETWPEAYDWPPRSQDPARYLILEKVATNVVRTDRGEEYLDDEGEITEIPIFTDEGVDTGETEDQENALAREYRLLVSEVNNMLAELNVTPKQQSRSGSVEKGANALEQIGEAVGDAIVNSDREYNPDDYGDQSSEDDNAAE